MSKGNKEEMILKFAALEQQARKIQQTMQAIEQNLAELEGLKTGLGAFDGVKGKEVFSPLGRGIFVKSEILSEELLVDVGGQTFVKKTPKEAETLVKEEIKRLERFKEQLGRDIESVNEDLQKLLGEIQEEGQ